MDSVDIMAPEGVDSWLLIGVFGDQKSIKGRIKAMNLVNLKIIFEKISHSENRVIS